MTKRERASRFLDERRLDLLARTGIIVTVIIAMVAIVGRFNDQSAALAQGARDRAELNRKLDEANANNAAMRDQVGDLTDQVAALRSQLVAAGIQPVVVTPPAPTPGSPRTTPSSSSPPTTAPPSSSPTMRPAASSTTRPCPTIPVVGACRP